MPSWHESEQLMTSPMPSLLRYHDVTSADGTRLRAWSNGADGPTVLLSNGLGTNPHAWPSLLQPDCGVHVISWNHRGIGGSERPANGRVDLDAFVEDAIAVMDDAGVESCAVVGWSAGVTIAFELAARHPERVTGILAVAGVPGNTFGTMLAPLRVPPVLARQLMVAFTRTAGLYGAALAPLTRRIPWTDTTANLVRRTHFVKPAADPAHLAALMQEFCQTHPTWYAKLAIGVSEHARVSLSNVDVPVTFLAGRWDIFTGARDMLSASQRVAGARYRELEATHFVPIEFPDIVLEELTTLLAEIEPAGS